MTSNISLPHSTFLDLVAYRQTTAATVDEAYNLNPAKDIAFIDPNPMFRFAIVIDRTQDPSSFLSQNWAQRQKALASLNQSGDLWKVYGADTVKYNAIVNTLKNSYGITVLDSTNSNYVSSAASHTIWIEVNSSQFKNLFGQEAHANLINGTTPLIFWNGALSLPSNWNVTGVWLDALPPTPSQNLAGDASATLSNGVQSIGNNVATSLDQFEKYPQKISAMYNFPLAGNDIKTSPIGLIETQIGTALEPGETSSFTNLLRDYLTTAGLTGTGKVTTQGGNAQIWKEDDASERSLDVGVVASINPNSDLKLYVGGGPQATIYTSYQSAFFDSTNAPSVISSSFTDTACSSPGSPFYNAYRQLFIDSVLANKTVLVSSGDSGSGGQRLNGLTNVMQSDQGAYSLSVGGTSLSNLNAATNDQTLSSVVTGAYLGDKAILWQLIAGGLKSTPQNLQQDQIFFESVWNNLYVNNYNIEGMANAVAQPGFGYFSNSLASGGVNTAEPTPSYQIQYGLTPTTSDALPQSGKGIPDVSANAGGNTFYKAPSANMAGTSISAGTSASTPLWAALISQIDTIFNDQGLPNLGYANDLLYIAAAVAPAAFNDVVQGNNLSSMSTGYSYTSNGQNINPTGFSYNASPGYDLATGLGSPNGLLLARALTAVAQAQMYSHAPPVASENFGYLSQSAVNQTLLVQNELNGLAASAFSNNGLVALPEGRSTYAWTSRFAQQSLQKDFDPALIKLFDGFSQGSDKTVSLDAGFYMSVSSSNYLSPLYQNQITNDYGFISYGSSAGDVVIARPVAIAQTAGGLDNQNALVRLRQASSDNLQLEIYRVDDLNGSINNVLPGANGYENLANQRAYKDPNGNVLINGPGYGNYSQIQIAGVNADDILAMKLINLTTHENFWVFSKANEKSSSGEGVTHLWNYGLNTWGWESTGGGGDRDYNDLIVGIDFTSLSGSGYLA